LGLTFRTDGFSTTDHRWTMWTGSTASSVTERFRITTLAGGSDVNIDNIETSTGIGGETQIQFRQAHFMVFARNKRLGSFQEIAGIVPDEVIFGDGTSVNTSAMTLNNRGYKIFGNSGNYRLGNFFTINPAANIQLDVIARDLTQVTTGPLDLNDVFFQGRIATDTLSFIRLQNGVTNNAQMVPTLVGHNEGNQFQGIAIVGRINPANDLAGNPTAVMEFDARASNPAAGNNAQIVNDRLLFNWCNFTQNNMSTNADGQLGLRTININNRLEINGQSTDPYFGSVNGQSGLRFTNMTSNNTPMTTNPGLGVLGLDANGDVIYVPGINFGNICGGVQNPLLNSWEIPLPGNTAYNFSEKGVVNITDVTNCAALSKLFVSSGSRQFSIGSVNTAVSGFAGFFQSTQPTGTGIYCTAPVTSSPPFAVVPPSLAIHVDGDAYVSGKVHLTSSASIVSDQLFKQNSNTIGNVTDLVMQLNPVTFEYNPSFNNRFHFPGGTNYGFIAQEVEQIIPELVSSNNAPAVFDTLGNELFSPLNYKSLNYQGIIPILTKAFQEQKTENDSLKEVVSELNERLNAQDSINNAMYAMITQCCQNNNSNQSMMQNGNGSNGYNPSVTNIELSDVQSIILNQNVPNPFAEQTTITFNLTEGVQKAQMLFYNLEGKLIKAEDISNKAGKGQVNVFANDLTNGIYSYTLVVDGKIIDTKRMVKQK